MLACECEGAEARGDGDGARHVVAPHWALQDLIEQLAVGPRDVKIWVRQKRRVVNQSIVPSHQALPCGQGDSIQRQCPLKRVKDFDKLSKRKQLSKINVNACSQA